MRAFFKTTCIAIALPAGISVSTRENAARFGVKAGVNYSGSYGDGNSSV
jgi:hypothetical protein